LILFEKSEGCQQIFFSSQHLTVHLEDLKMDCQMSKQLDDVEVNVCKSPRPLFFQEQSSFHRICSDSHELDSWAPVGDQLFDRRVVQPVRIVQLNLAQKSAVSQRIAKLFRGVDEIRQGEVRKARSDLLQQPLDVVRREPAARELQSPQLRIRRLKSGALGAE